MVKSIVVTGSTGYIGSHLVTMLVKAGYNVYAYVSANSDPVHIAFLKVIGATVISNHKMTQTFNYLPADCDLLIHLIGSVEPKYGQSSLDLHVNPTKDLINNCKNNNVKNLILVSSLIADKDANSQYARSKWQQEQILKESNLNYVILRPSLVYGKSNGIRDSKLVLKYIKYIQKLPIVPIINNGITKIQPIFIDDLNTIILSIIDNLSSEIMIKDTILSLGGNEVLSFKEFVQKLMNLFQIKKMFFNIDSNKTLKFIPLMNSLGINTTNLYEQLLIASQDNICVNNDTNKFDKIKITELDTGLQSYLNF